jgi:hypothetical protein
LLINDPTHYRAIFRKRIEGDLKFGAAKRHEACVGPRGLKRAFSRRAHSLGVIIHSTHRVDAKQACAESNGRK